MLRYDTLNVSRYSFLSMNSTPIDIDEFQRESLEKGCNLVVKIDDLIYQTTNYFNNDLFKELIRKKINDMLDELNKFTSGKIYLIAIPKEHIENGNINYIYRSHPFGRFCNCVSASNKQGHDNFVEVLLKNNNGECKPCNEDESDIIYPQYRILAKNLDDDKNKKIFTISALNEMQNKVYASIVNNLKILVKTFARLQKINLSTTAKELESIILRIDIKKNILKQDVNDYKLYINGIANELKEKIEIIQKHKEYLFKNLPKDHQEFLIRNKLV